MNPLLKGDCYSPPKPPLSPSPPPGVWEVRDTPPRCTQQPGVSVLHPRLPSGFCISCNVKLTPNLGQRSGIAQPGRCSAGDVSQTSQGGLQRGHVTRAEILPP